jgi:hypothetical protein
LPDCATRVFGRRGAVGSFQLARSPKTKPSPLAAVAAISERHQAAAATNSDGRLDAFSGGPNDSLSLWHVPAT